jgi:hypothetical protein
MKIVARDKSFRIDPIGVSQSKNKFFARANEFLQAMDLRGLSPQSARSYAFDLLALSRWLEKS